MGGLEVLTIVASSREEGPSHCIPFSLILVKWAIKTWQSSDTVHSTKEAENHVKTMGALNLSHHRAYYIATHHMIVICGIANSNHHH